MQPIELLTTTTVIPYLVAQHIGRDLRLPEELGGGVSNVVIRVRDVSSSIIVKQSLPLLRVAEEWAAPRARIINEAEAMRLVGELIPDSVPAVLLSDPDEFVMAMEAAPDEWADWRIQLLNGTVNTSTARRVGTITGDLHRATLSGESLSPRLRDPESFEQLRLRPYYEHTALAQPQWAVVLAELADELRNNRRCLVHGDLSPKNILSSTTADAPRAWLIDFEVAHFGDPRFDLAFLLSHLTLKAIHLPSHADSIDECAVAFIESYTATAGRELAPDLPGSLRHVGALLLARIYGKSKIDYLSARERTHTVRVATAAVAGELRDLRELFDHREATRQ